MSANALTLSQYLEMVNPVTGQVALNVDKITNAINMGLIEPSEGANLISQYSGRTVTPIYDATTARQTIGSWQYAQEVTYTTPNPVNSNAGTVSRGTINKPISTTIDPNTGKVVAREVVGKGSRVLTGIANVASWAAAASVGITLGKTIDGLLYNVNPDFFDSHGMSSFNPETWASITNGIDYNDPITGTAANAFNFLFDIDPDTGESQAYMRDDAFAYIASWMQANHVFDAKTKVVESYDGGMGQLVNPNIINSYPAVLGDRLDFKNTNNRNSIQINFVNNTDEVIQFYYTPQTTGTRVFYVIAVSQAPFTAQLVYYGRPETYSYNAGKITISGVDYYIWNPSGQTLGQSNQLTNYAEIAPYININSFRPSTTNNNTDMIKVLLGGEISESGGVEGIGTQGGATTPQNLTGDIPTDYNLLQQQYPDLWNNAIDYPVLQPDGTVTNYKYIPVTLPDVSSNTQAQPTSGTQTQQNPLIDPATSPQNLVQYLTDLLQQNPTQLQPTEPSDNPTDTGEGSSPAPIPPVGAASALWAIYHPTQAEIDSFGAWLWSPSFIDQIAKIFNNPMESIIGLHKIYATPVDAGTSTIVVGYLDSQVSSAYITQQYVNVDCGSVNLAEQFGNVFDYAPFTSVKLYLPFIGIVSLDVSEVMRSAISISYGVDVLTGACLARVTVARDANSSILYQFAGNCAVQYPLSMGSYMGIVSSILGVAGSAVATFASGGSLAPLAIGAASAAFGAHTSVQNSGSFSGNAGAMGGKKPYLIIERPQTRMADGQEAYIGIPTNYNSVVGDYSGYIRASSVHLEGVTATDTELDMIQSLLEGGILA